MPYVRSKCNCGLCALCCCLYLAAGAACLRASTLIDRHVRLTLLLYKPVTIKLGATSSGESSLQVSSVTVHCALLTAGREPGGQGLWSGTLRVAVCFLLLCNGHPAISVSARSHSPRWFMRRCQGGRACPCPHTTSVARVGDLLACRRTPTPFFHASPCGRCQRCASDGMDVQHACRRCRGAGQLPRVAERGGARVLTACV